jgi:hypothetical protein
VVHVIPFELSTLLLFHLHLQYIRARRLCKCSLQILATFSTQLFPSKPSQSQLRNSNSLSMSSESKPSTTKAYWNCPSCKKKLSPEHLKNACSDCTVNSGKVQFLCGPCYANAYNNSQTAPCITATNFNTTSGHSK